MLVERARAGVVAAALAVATIGAGALPAVGLVPVALAFALVGAVRRVLAALLLAVLAALAGLGALLLGVLAALAVGRAVLSSGTAAPAAGRAVSGAVVSTHSDNDRRLSAQCGTEWQRKDAKCSQMQPMEADCSGMQRKV